MLNPADRTQVVGEVIDASFAQVAWAIETAARAAPSWNARPIDERARCLERLADALETNRAELMALAVLEAGKTFADALADALGVGVGVALAVAEGLASPFIPAGRPPGLSAFSTSEKFSAAARISTRACPGTTTGRS